MHETIIAKQIIEKAEEQAKLNNSKVLEITVEVGDLGHLPADEMKEVLENLKGKEWKINITQKKALVKCNCGYQGEPKILEKGHDHNVFVCPECGEIPQILEGENIILKSVKLE